MDRAKTFNRFINEAYVDASGELRDFQGPSDHEYDVRFIEEAQKIQDYLIDLGAKHVILNVEVPQFVFYFKYKDHNYSMFVDIDSETTEIYYLDELVFSDSISSFIDVANANGLDFLNY